MRGFFHRVVLLMGLSVLASLTMRATEDENFDYAAWEKDFDTLVSHLRMEYVPPTDKPRVLSPKYLAWRAKHLRNASPEIKAEALSTLEKVVHSDRNGPVQASYIEYLGSMGTLDSAEVEKVTNLVVDISRIDQDWGRNSARVGAFLESFLPNQPVPHREEIAIRALGSGDVYIRSAAAVALSCIGTEKGLAALKNCLLTHENDSDKDVSLHHIRHFTRELEKRLSAKTEAPPK